VFEMSKTRDLTGEISGRLKAISFAGRDAHGNALWLCRCECGEEVIVKGYNLVANASKSCGCLRKEKIRESNTKHGMHGSRLYQIWNGMLTRCENEKRHDYKYYGGRGISVCEEWHGFADFLAWAIGNGYSEELTIDRKQVNGNYCPENCRWVTFAEQMRNTRRSSHGLAEMK
jgi:hypothetical protein